MGFPLSEIKVRFVHQSDREIVGLVPPKHTGRPSVHFWQAWPHSENRGRISAGPPVPRVGTRRANQSETIELAFAHELLCIHYERLLGVSRISNIKKMGVSDIRGAA